MDSIKKEVLAIIEGANLGKPTPGQFDWANKVIWHLEYNEKKGVYDVRCDLSEDAQEYPVVPEWSIKIHHLIMQRVNILLLEDEDNWYHIGKKYNWLCYSMEHFSVQIRFFTIEDFLNAKYEAV